MVAGKVPFVPNSPDNTHCFQAAISMVLKYFDPSNNLTFPELEKITAKKEGKWTWTMAGLIWLAEHGYDVRRIELFDFRRFSVEGKEYLRELRGDEVAEAQDKNGNIPQEQKFAVTFEEKIEPELRTPDYDDIRNLLRDGYLVICNVNSRALNDREGYSGHFVVVYDLQEGMLFFHDPGLPPQESRSMKTENFERAWAYPEENAKNISAIRLRTT